MPRILVTNDDGVFSEGIKLLANALADVAEVVVVAPDREQSATGHSLTLHRPLRMQQLDDNVYSVDGTPTDCVNLAVHELFPDPPDWVVSGINMGWNVGFTLAINSGTVGGALEAALLLLLEPVMATVWTWLVHGEQPGPWSLAGCLVILTASVASVLSRRE